MLAAVLKKPLDLFSSVWLGVTLLALLFVYCSVGSSGVPIHPNILDPASWTHIRDKPFFEMSEFEWFHWWPFDVLISLICLNLTVVTIRRIPLNVVNLGVWMIHSGIIILCLGSVYYFSTKVEGLSPVLRRQVVVVTPDGQRAAMPALPGNQRTIVTDDGTYQFRVASLNPHWELLSGEDVGTRAFSVNVMVQTPTQSFMRQLIAGYPQYTEDLIQSGNPNQPFARAVKETGAPLVDELLDLSLGYDEQQWVYLRESRAVYLREVGTTEWTMRPIEGLPRFNDHVASYDQVWITAQDRGKDGRPNFPVRSIDVAAPVVEADDPLANATLHVTGYLRYAFEETRRVAGGTSLFPELRVRLDAEGRSVGSYRLVAFDPAANTAEQGSLQFVWADTEAARDALQSIEPSRLTMSVAEAEIELNVEVTDTVANNPSLEFTPIEGTDYAYRVSGLQDGLMISGQMVNMAFVEIRTPERTFTRWVFEETSMNRDHMPEQEMGEHGERRFYDEGIRMAYRPGRHPAPITFIAGPGHDELGVMIQTSATSSTFQSLAVGEPIRLQTGADMTVTSFSAHTTPVTKPIVVPRSQRDPNLASKVSMIRVEIPSGDNQHAVWLGFHDFAFANQDETLVRFPYQPRVVDLQDGRRLELMYAPARMRLPTPVALDDFILDTHVGGFSGSTVSIRDWTSMVTFRDENGWTEPMDVHMNAPKEHGGYWFYQAQWDAPLAPNGGRPGHPGLSYTVLGVGNRNGVVTQLLGCCIAVIGMIYAFYVKPVLKRRRQRAVYAQVAASATREADEPIVASEEVCPVPVLAEDHA